MILAPSVIHNVRVQADRIVVNEVTPDGIRKHEVKGAVTVTDLPPMSTVDKAHRYE